MEGDETRTNNLGVTLLQMIAFCFEKDEVSDGWGYRCCPFPTEEDARAAFDAWVEELSRWKGAGSVRTAGTARKAEWADIRVKQSGRGIGMWIARGSIDAWWATRETWAGGPCDGVLLWGY